MTQETGNILIVDDNEMNRDLLQRRLERSGHQVTNACDGTEALEKIGQYPFDLVLLDIMMPGMNGYEVLDALKKDEKRRHIPVIMISALNEMDSVVKCIELGAEDFLPKPFRPVLLRARVNACLEKKRLRDQEERFLEELQTEKKKAEDLLQVILPLPVIQELKATNTVKPKRYDNVAVIFSDVVNFTSYCEHRAPEEVVAHLQELVSIFEDLSLKHGIQKIKTIGDAYMGAAGLLGEMENPVQACIDCGQEMIRASRELRSQWNVRVGIHYGPVMGGVVGHRQYLFDVWGDTVNTAARIEESGHKDSVSLSQEAWDVSGCQLPFTKRVVEVKGKGSFDVIDLVVE